MRIHSLFIYEIKTKGYKIIDFIIHSKYFPNFDWLKAHA